MSLHALEYNVWMKSDHYYAKAVAGESSVEANFQPYGFSHKWGRLPVL